jgi:hypothetical protein
MKAISVLLIAVTSFALTSFVAKPKEASVTFNYAFKGIVDGYDHDTKMVISEDGTVIAESSVQKQSKPNSITVKLKPGTHSLRAVMMAHYEGSWEEHLKANDYSIDCLYEQTLKLKGKKTISLLFDIDEEKTIVK